MTIMEAATLSTKLRRKDWNQWHEFKLGTNELWGTICLKPTPITRDEILADDWEIPTDTLKTDNIDYEGMTGLTKRIFKCDLQEFEISIKRVPKPRRDEK